MDQFLLTLSTCLRSDTVLLAIRRRGALGGALSFQCGSSDKPLPLKPLAISLTRSSIFRVRIERMSIILDLLAIRIGHHTQCTREGRCTGGRPSAREEQQGPDARTRPRPRILRRGIWPKVIQVQTLAILEE